MKIEFIKRNQEGLHCRFCRETVSIVELFETKPVKGIVCSYCKDHLECYLD